MKAVGGAGGGGGVNCFEFWFYRYQQLIAGLAALAAAFVAARPVWRQLTEMQRGSARETIALISPRITDARAQQLLAELIERYTESTLATCLDLVRQEVSFEGRVSLSRW